MSDQRNLILAIVLSVGIILLFQVFYEMPRVRDAQERMQQQAEQRTPAPGAVTPSAPALPQAQPGRPAAPGAQPSTAPGAPAQDVARVPIDNGRLLGSISLQGGRIDDVRLADYFVTTADQEEIVLLSPTTRQQPYFLEFGWVPTDRNVRVPAADTVWTRTDGGGPLTASDPLTLAWDNGAGLRFERTIALDENYLFTITQRVVNQSDRPVSLHAYGLSSRWGTPETMGFYILHEGPIGVLDGTLHEVDYSDLVDDGGQSFRSPGGWLGITDKYWLTALVPDQEGTIQADFRHTAVGDQQRYQVDYLRPALVVQPGGSAEATDRAFAGAKELELLDAYAEEYQIPLFDRAIDFGWFYFLTKPLAQFLHFLYGVVGNYGVAILVLTLIVKAVFFPLANKSYTAMSKMKKLQPEMMKLRDRFGDDKMKLNQEMMALYKREKVNPVSGCLPMVIQIPVFFALYKVLFVSTEMRHAPFFGWITDLSAPDPTSLFNLFGLLPFTPPQILMIGVWPILMGLTMLLQMKLNPTPPDPIQAKIMTFLPLVFTFMFATFPAGLVIYWTWNNILSIAQQWLIMRRMHVPVTSPA